MSDAQARYNGHDNAFAERRYDGRPRDICGEYAFPEHTEQTETPQGLTARTQPDLAKGSDDGDGNEIETGVQATEGCGAEQTKDFGMG